MTPSSASPRTTPAEALHILWAGVVEDATAPVAVAGEKDVQALPLLAAGRPRIGGHRSHHCRSAQAEAITYAEAYSASTGTATRGICEAHNSVDSATSSLAGRASTSQTGPMKFGPKTAGVSAVWASTWSPRSPVAGCITISRTKHAEAYSLANITPWIGLPSRSAGRRRELAAAPIARWLPPPQQPQLPPSPRA